MVGNVFGGIFLFFSAAITAAALLSFGVTTALMFGCAVYCCSNRVWAVGGSHVPVGSPTFL